MKNIKNEFDFETENGKVVLDSVKNDNYSFKEKTSKRNSVKIAKLLKQNNEDVPSEIEDIFEMMNLKKATKQNQIKMKSYFAKRKRLALYETIAPEELEGYVNDYLDLANEYLSTENPEMSKLMEEIKSDVNVIVQKIENRTFYSWNELSSNLDVPVLKAVNADVLFDEVRNGYLYLLDAQNVPLNKTQAKVIENMYLACEDKKARVDADIEYQLTKPNELLKSNGVDINLLKIINVPAPAITNFDGRGMK